MECIPITSEAGNYYLYSPALKQIIISSEAVNGIVDWHLHHKIPIPAPDSEIREAFPNIRKKEVGLSIKKIGQLSASGFFRPVDFSKKFNGKISPDAVVIHIANSRQITFEVTSRCNLDCEYCTFGKYYNNKIGRVHNDLSFETAKAVIDYFFGIWDSQKNISVNSEKTIGFYGGEPLLCVDLVKKITAYAEKKANGKFPLTFSMTTNGTLIHKHLDFLAEMQIRLLVSLDGDQDGNSYRCFHNGRESHSMICKNLDLLKAKYPEYFEQFVSFNAVLHNRNSVSGLLNYFRDKFGKTIRISEMSTDGLDEENATEFWRKYSNIYESLYQAEDYSSLRQNFLEVLPDSQTASKFISRMNVLENLHYHNLITSDQEENYLPTGTCQPFSRKIFVSATGKILPCERIDHNFMLGNVENGAVVMDHLKIASFYNTAFDKVKRNCSKCYALETCQQCFFYLDILDEKPGCKGLTGRKQMEDLLRNNISYIEQDPESVLKTYHESAYE